MRRLIPALTLLGCLALCGNAWAFPNFSFGASLEYFHPLDADLWGQTMANNSWGRDIAGFKDSVGKDRNSFYTFNRYNGIVSPGLSQSLTWDFGLSVELAERWQWLIWAPNKDVDIIYDRIAVPITVTPKYSFLPTGSFHPTVSAGVGVYYFYTHIYGDDLYDQHRNADFPNEGIGTQPDPDIPTPKEFFRTPRDFKANDWFVGGHVGAGFDLDLGNQLLLSLAFRYSIVPAESIEAVRVREGNIHDWHWEEGKIKGDAGGVSGSVGLSYMFLR